MSWLKVVLAIFTIGSLSLGTYFYSTQSDDPLAYKLRNTLGMASKSWDQNLVETYVELRISTRRFGQKTPKGQSYRQAILETYGYSAKEYHQAIETLKSNYQEWFDFQNSVVERIKELDAEIKKSNQTQRKEREAKAVKQASEKPSSQDSKADKDVKDSKTNKTTYPKVNVPRKNKPTTPSNKSAKDSTQEKSPKEIKAPRRTFGFGSSRLKIPKELHDEN